MARPVSEKCRRCAKLPVEKAKTKECWEGQKCHVRRSNYKKRDLRNRQRRKQYRVNQGVVPAEAEVMSAAGEVTTTQVIEVPVPQSVGAIVHFWRQNQSAPLHAIGFELYRNGVKTVEVPPVHTIGWDKEQVKQYMRDVLRSLSQHVGQEINKFEAQVEHSPETCQIEDCPLRGAGD
ncbi:MAG: hypothetical protein HC810_03540 [Acaryochloridaceae cyanobacterium RL_2_7]|nr:hypothetical protein [Acaryochloridaceae cyanobacterium RL_2_7]